jgi:hypothetical protein
MRIRKIYDLQDRILEALSLEMMHNKEHPELPNFDFSAIRRSILEYNDFQDTYLADSEGILKNKKAQREIEKWKKYLQ